MQQSAATKYVKYSSCCKSSFRAHSHGRKFAVNPHVSAAHCCSAAKNRKSSILLHHTCLPHLPHLHASNTALVNHPLLPSDTLYISQIVSQSQRRRHAASIMKTFPARKNVPATVPRPAPVHPEPVGVAANELALGAELLVVVAMTHAADAAATSAKFNSFNFDTLK